MKLSLPALLDAGRRFAAGLAVSRRRRPFSPRQARLARRSLFLLGLTLASLLAMHPPVGAARLKPAASAQALH